MLSTKSPDLVHYLVDNQIAVVVLSKPAQQMR
jgi:hypothetical protein